MQRLAMVGTEIEMMRVTNSPKRRRSKEAEDGEGKRGDVEKVYCSGSTAGRDHGLAWLFGEQEDSKGEEGKGTSEAADEEGAAPIVGDGPPRDGKAERSCAEDEDYWYADENGPAPDRGS